MKYSIFAVLLALLITPQARAADAPLVDVRFTYVDTPVFDLPQKDRLALTKQTTGNALARFLLLVKTAHLHSKVTPGPEITTASGVRASLDQTHLATSVSLGTTGVDWVMGPRIALTPTVVKSDLVSVVLNISDMESVGPNGYWFKQAKVASANAAPLFQAHSGSTVLLGGCYSSNSLERWTFATVFLLPAAKG